MLNDRNESCLACGLPFAHSIPMQRSKMRLFIGIKPDTENLQDLVWFQDQFKSVDCLSSCRETCRWVPAENIHMTLHFLGPVSSNLAGKLIQCLSEETLGKAHEQIVDVAVAFPRPSCARVAGVGGAITKSELKQCHKNLSRIIEGLGLSVEDRPFFPHITLVRFHKPQALKKGELDKVLSSRPLIFRSCHISLFESCLSPKGAKYRIVEQFPLAAPASS